jgi:hypothetical protein
MVFSVGVGIGFAVAPIGTRSEGVDRAGVADTLAMNAPLDGRTVVSVDRFEIVASVLRRDVEGVERIGPAVLA